jgi:hypothetical protein
MPIANLQISEAGYLWIFSAVLVIHLAEEFWGGVRLSSDRDKLRGLDLSAKGFLVINLVVLSSLVFIVVMARALGFPQFFLVTLGTLALFNGARHIITGLRLRAYSPGLLTGLAVLIPLGLWTLIRLEQTMSHRRFGWAIGTGLVMQLGASFIGHRSRQIVRSFATQEKQRQQCNR